MSRVTSQLWKTEFSLLLKMHTTWTKLGEGFMSLRTQSELFHSGYFKMHHHLKYLIIVNLDNCCRFYFECLCARTPDRFNVQFDKWSKL